MHDAAPPPMPDAQQPRVRPPPLRRRAFWPLWAASVTLPLALLAGAAVFAWDRIQDAARADLRSSVDILHEHARRAFETQDTLLGTLQWHTRGLSWAEIAASAELAEMLRHLGDVAPGTGNMGMVAPDGRVAQIGASPFPPPPIDFSDRDYVRHQQGAEAGPFVSGPLTGRLTGRPAFNYSRPRLGPDGRPDGGTLWTTFRPRAFGAVYEAHAAGTQDEIMLLRSTDGLVLASHPEMPPGTIGPAFPRQPTPRARGEMAFVEAPSPADGERRLYAARVLPGMPVMVAQGLHPDGPASEWRREMAGMSAVAATAMLVLLWLTWLVRSSARAEALALARGRAEAERRAEAEAALRQRQRLGVLGEVAAGVAHDFRNTVQAVQGGVVLARKAVDAGDADRARSLLAMVSEAAGRGAALTERMLRLARREEPAEAGRPAGSLNPAAVLTAAAELLSRTLPPGYPVTLEIRREGLPARVNGDATELEAAVLNLALNARDAMPDGGSIAIRLDAGAGGAAGDGPSPAEARITVTDSGTGMDEETLKRVSEPFFTTKAPGKGTGLGLASVRAFVLRAGGSLRVESDGPGRGSSVTLRLPAATPPAG
ncbi:ATP-binding protein [Falsiroseomonas sp. CW058]|uniref:ATP-binding protein n=1 Tax=Falsiroseomonas sp. CW058 TaxID=3388664 RepID=UPI003D3161F4